MYRIGGIEMELPIIVGAGVCKTPESILPYMRPDVSVGAVFSGAYTPEDRKGNDGVLSWPNDYGEFLRAGFGLNAFGMPNMGCGRAALAFQPKYRRPLGVNLAGFSVQDYVDWTALFQDCEGIAVVEENFGCPNAHDKKPLPIAYDLDTQRQIYDALSKRVVWKPIWVKLSAFITSIQREWLQKKYPHIDFSSAPIVEPWHLRENMLLIRNYPFIRAVVFSNTLGNVIYRDASGKPVTTPNDGKAGLSGPIVKAINIDLIKVAADLLPEHLDIVALGGAVSGDDAVDYFETSPKVKAVACTSGPFWGGGARFFADFIAGSERLQNYLLQFQP